MPLKHGEGALHEGPKWMALNPALVVLRGGALGDHVLTLPAVARLRRLCPDQPMYWIGHPDRGRLARPDHLVDADGPIGAALYGAEPSIPDWLRSADRIVAYSSSSERLAYRLQAACSGQIVTWDPRPNPERREHTIDHLLAPLPPCDPARPEDRVPRFSPMDEERSAARQHWADANIDPEDVVVIHAGSGGVSKCWPPGHFLQLGEWLERHGHAVVLLRGPAESENGHLFRTLTDRWPSISAVDPVVLASLLADIRCLIGNDSGPAHLAAAVGTTTLTLFGPTDPTRWRPVGGDGLVVQSPTSQMADLAVDAVCDAARNLMQPAD